MQILLSIYGVYRLLLHQPPIPSLFPFAISSIPTFLYQLVFNVSLGRLISEAIFKKRPRCLFGSLLRDLIGPGKPFLLFLLDHVLEAEVFHMVSCELRTVILLRSEALNLSPEINQELWLKPPWTC